MYNDLLETLPGSLHALVYKLISRVGRNRIYAPYMTVYMVISLPKIPYTHRIYMVLANPTYKCSCRSFGLVFVGI